jgi:hypothetical protein
VPSASGRPSVGSQLVHKPARLAAISSVSGQPTAPAASTATRHSAAAAAASDRPRSSATARKAPRGVGHGISQLTASGNSGG